MPSKRVIGKSAIISAISLALILSTLLGGCRNTAKEVVEKTDESKKNMYQELVLLEEVPAIKNINNENSSPTTIEQYIRTQLEMLSYDSFLDENGTITATIPATKNYEDAPTVILLASMHSILFGNNDKSDIHTTGIQIYQDIENDMIRGIHSSIMAKSRYSILSILSVLKNTKDHGPLKLIFLSSKYVPNEAAAKLTAEQTRGDYLISFLGNKSNTIITQFPYSAISNINATFTSKETENKYAYVIAASIDKSKLEANEKIDISPIELISNVLLETRAQGILFEISSFTSDYSDEFPLLNQNDSIKNEASAIITLNDYEFKKLSKIFKDMKAEYKTLTKNEKLVFELVQANLPTYSLGNDATNQVLNYLEGIYSLTDTNDDITSSSSTSSCIPISIGLKKGVMNVELIVKSDSSRGIKSTLTNMEKISELSQLAHPDVYTVSGYDIKETAFLPDTFSSIYKSDLTINSTFSMSNESSPIGEIVKLNSDLQAIELGADIVYENTVREGILLSTMTNAVNSVVLFLAKNEQ